MSVQRSAGLAALVVALGIGPVDLAQTGQGSRSDAGPMPGVRSELHAVTVGGKIHVVGARKDYSWTIWFSPCLEQSKQALGCYRQLRHSERQAQCVVDRGCNRRPDGRDAGFACTLDAERVERAGSVFGQEHFDVGDLARGRDEIIGESHRKRLSIRAVEEFLI